MTTIGIYSTPEKWEEISRNPYYKDARDELLEIGEKFLACPIPELTFEAWMKYRETGIRSDYEKAYFQRRGRLAVFAIMSRLTGESRWLSALEETIWAVCEEFAWAVPAHLAQMDNISEMPQELDLFSTETAHALGEISVLLKDSLSPLLIGRMRAEVRRRVIDPFLESPPLHWRWELWENNWVSVCASGITHSLVYFGEPGELEDSTERILQYAKRFLDGFPDDGACLEGSSYWLYGFGFFAQMAETLFYHSNGSLNLFKWDKVEKIAGFLPKTCLCGKWSVMISDANNREFIHDAGLTHLLARRFPTVPLLPQSLRRPLGMDECYRFGTLLRNLLWTFPTQLKPLQVLNDVYFPQAQWYIANRETYACILKAGHNDEPHNHNDIGHIALVSAQDGYVLCDLGAGAYTADYFHPQTRYSKLNNASRGHSVPLINGKEQLAGRKYVGDLKQEDENTLTVEFSQAYGQSELKRLERNVFFFENKVSLRDSFEFSQCPAELAERFITELRPIITNEDVRIGGMRLLWDSALWSPHLTKEKYEDHFGAMLTAYFIEFTPKELSKQMYFELTMKFTGNIL